jgi:hypothetical protein
VYKMSQFSVVRVLFDLCSAALLRKKLNLIDEKLKTPRRDEPTPCTK